jgi:diacylglycerol kinase family enzyme
MDLWLFEGENFGDTILMVWDVLGSRHVDSAKVHHAAFKHLMIESDSSLYVQVDAEPLTSNNHSVEINVIAKGIRVIIPSETPRELFSNNDSL